MSIRFLSAFAALLLPGALLAQVPDAYQVNYAANLNVGDSVVNLVNAGSNDGFSPTGDICANVYVYNPNEEPISCCYCRLTPNALRHLSANNDLRNNPLIAEPVPNSIVIKLYATVPVNNACNAAAPGAAAPGLRAWRTTLHAGPLGYTPTENAFSPATLSAGELGKLTAVCAFTQQFGTGHGVCNNACALGGLAAPDAANDMLKPGL